VSAAAAVSIKLTYSGGVASGASLSSAVQLLNRSHKSWNKLFKFMMNRWKKRYKDRLKVKARVTIRFFIRNCLTRVERFVFCSLLLLILLY
jgi:hypothetical protein